MNLCLALQELLKSILILGKYFFLPYFNKRHIRQCKMRVWKSIFIFNVWKQPCKWSCFNIIHGNQFSPTSLKTCLFCFVCNRLYKWFLGLMCILFENCMYEGQEEKMWKHAMSLVMNLMTPCSWIFYVWPDIIFLLPHCHLLSLKGCYITINVNIVTCV